MICGQIGLAINQSSFSEGNEKIYILLEETKKFILC